MSTAQLSNLPTLQLTPDHPVYVEGKGWLWAENLAVGDRLRRSDGGWAKVLAVERVRLAESQPVYNFTVKGPHTYFVLEVGVLVHNDSCDILRPDLTAEERAQSAEAFLRKRGGFTEEQIADAVNKVRNAELPEGSLGEWIKERHGIKTDEFNCIGAVLCDYRKAQEQEPLTNPNTGLDDMPSEWFNPHLEGDRINYDPTYQVLNENYNEVLRVDASGMCQVC